MLCIASNRHAVTTFVAKRTKCLHLFLHYDQLQAQHVHTVFLDKAIMIFTQFTCKMSEGQSAQYIHSYV